MTYIPNFNVLSKLETINFIKDNHSSLVRFGDGELNIINGHSIPYQEFNPELVSKLKNILEEPSTSSCVICLPDVFQSLSHYNNNARNFWNNHLSFYQEFYSNISVSPWYGNSFISRPYMDLNDKSETDVVFDAIRSLWEGKELLIVEGETSRSGVGNDLFSNAGQLERIICPSRNAFQEYKNILEKIKESANGKLVLIMLGPTAKLLAYDLSQQGIQAIDIGHIDTEYEWYKMNATGKVKLINKHTAEYNDDKDIILLEDEEYEQSIVSRIGL